MRIMGIRIVVDEFSGVAQLPRIREATYDTFMAESSCSVQDSKLHSRKSHEVSRAASTDPKQTFMCSGLARQT